MTGERRPASDHLTFGGGIFGQDELPSAGFHINLADLLSSVKYLIG
jgi:hypothetical protein